MQNRLLAASAAVLFLTAAAPAPTVPDPTVHYVAHPVVVDGKLESLAIEIRFAGDNDGETRLDLPSRWAGETEYWKHLRDLQVENAEVREDGPEARILTHAPNATVTVRYRIVSAYDVDPAVGGTNGNPYRPIVRPGWFSAIGHGLFASPGDNASRDADFRWRDVPEGWRVASDLDHSAMGAHLRIGDIQQSVMVGSPGLKIHTREVKGADVRLAVLGDWSAFKEADFADLIARVLTAQRDYWKADGETFFVALTPMTPQEGSMSVGGTGLDDAFSIYAGTDTTLDPMRYLLAHEHMHTWSPRQLGNMASGQDEAADYWFSEGFTDFLTHRTLLRSGIWSLEDFVGHLNNELIAYWSSPSRSLPNAAIVEKFWTSADVQKLPYRRGMLLALKWDHDLRRATRGKLDLDDVLARQVVRAEAVRRAGGDPMAAQLFAEMYRAAGGADLANDYAVTVQGGQTVILPADLFGDCARVETVSRPRFHRGWDAQATTAAGNVMTGLRDDSPAYAAGLRNGMQIVKREFGEVGNSTVEYGLRVRAGDGTETVYRFMPVAPGVDTFQRIVLAEGLSGDRKAACARRMSGG